VLVVRRVLTCALVVLLVGASALPAAAGTGWREELAAERVRVEADAPRDLKADAAARIAALDLAPPLTAAQVEAVATDAATRYADEVRPATRSDAAAAFDHDKTVAAGLQALLNSGRIQDVDALADLLHADRATVAAMIRDVEVLAATSGGAAVEGDLRKARDFLDKADRDWAKGQPVSVMSHLTQAVSRLWAALERLGIRYDAEADGDDDGASDLVELRFGADPLRADTDGDGLTDGFEIFSGVPYLSPLQADTDEDGTGDADEDTDRDGLLARDEQTHGTSELKPDTDGDGVSDGDEVAAGTDPLVPDQVADEVTVSTGDGVAVHLQGSGLSAGEVTITPLPPDSPHLGAAGQVGGAYDITLSGATATGFESARVTLPYDESYTGDPADLRVFVYDTGEHLWLPAAIDQDVDPVSRTVTSEVPHFSVFALFNIRNWATTWTGIGGSCQPRGGTGDIVFVDVAFTLDSSGSMTTNDPLGLRRTAAKSFVDALLPEDRAAVVDFDDGARLLQPLTHDKDAVKAAIDMVDDVGGTNIGAGVNLAVTVLELAPPAEGGDTRAKIVILLTDGQGSYSHALTDRAVAAGITIYTIGLGSDVDAALLTEIAERTGGSYYAVADATDLPEVFREISEDTGDSGVDSDGDGLTDCQEERGVAGRGGRVFTSNPQVPDTDGDGLLDGEEIGPRRTLGELDILWWEDLLEGTDIGDLAFHTVHSDPRAADSDGDGLPDPAEADLSTDAFDADSDNDGLSDATEIDLGTDPTDRDTDRDRHDDGYEHAHRDDGFDPLVYDVPMSGWDYAGEFARGLICGEACPSDTIPWLLGNLAGGASSAIPVIGWITGTLADIRDAIASAIRGEWVGAGLSIAGLVPYAGDAGAVLGKVGRFAARNADKADEIAVAVLKAIDLPPSVQLDVLRRVYRSGVVDELLQRGVGQGALVRLATGRVDLEVLADGLRRSTAPRVGSAPFFSSWRDAEEFVRRATGGVPKYFPTDPLGRGRFIDSCTGCDVLGEGIAREVKSGYVRYSSRIEQQIRKDAELLARGQVARVEWHFVASASSNSLGADPRVLDLLDQHGIPYTIYPPGG